MGSGYIQTAFQLLSGASGVKYPFMQFGFLIHNWVCVLLILLLRDLCCRYGKSVLSDETVVLPAIVL